MYRKAHLASLILAPLLASAAAVPDGTTPMTTPTAPALASSYHDSAEPGVPSTTPLVGQFIIQASPRPVAFKHIRRQLVTDDGTATLAGTAPTGAPDVSGQDTSVADTTNTILSESAVTTAVSKTASASEAIASSTRGSLTTSAASSASASSTQSVYVKPPKPTTVSSKGSLVTGAEVPSVCAQGCEDTFAHIDACDTTPSTCPNLCDYIVYTATVTCFNCLVGNSAPDVNATTLSTMLHDVGDMCEGVGHSLLSFGRVTAKPTATGEMVRFDLGAAVTAMPWTWTRTGDGARNNQPTGGLALKTGGAGPKVDGRSWTVIVGSAAVMVGALWL